MWKDGAGFRPTELNFRKCLTNPKYIVEIAEVTMLIIITLLFMVISVESAGNERPGSKNASPPNQQPDEEDDLLFMDQTSPEKDGIRGMASAGLSMFSSKLTIPKCMGQSMRMEKVIQVTLHCQNKTGEGRNETEENVPRSLCFTACMWKYLGLIGEDLIFTASIDTVVIDLFPPAAHWMMKKAMRSCAKQSVLPLNLADNCSSFGPVKGCFLRNTINICNSQRK